MLFKRPDAKIQMKRRPRTQLITFAFIGAVAFILVQVLQSYDAQYQKRIFELVKAHQAELSLAVEAAQLLDSDIRFVSHTEKLGIPDGKSQGISGLYAAVARPFGTSYEKLDNMALDAALKLNEIREIALAGRDRYIIFSCGGSGVASAAAFRGFYYSMSGEPWLITEGGNEVLTPEKNRWVWREAGGNNRYETEKIAENWYYYTAVY